MTYLELTSENDQLYTTHLFISTQLNWAKEPSMSRQYTPCAISVRPTGRLLPKTGPSKQTLHVLTRSDITPNLEPVRYGRTFPIFRTFIGPFLRID